MGFVIRAATVGDARAIAEVQVAGWHAAYRGLMPDATLDACTVEVREPKWAQNLAEAGGPRTTVLVREGRVIGFACVGPSRDEPRSAEVWALYVAPDAWGTGAGRALLEDGLASLDARGYASTTLWVLRGNARAIRFYEAANFVIDGEKLGHDGLPTLRMRRLRT